MCAKCEERCARTLYEEICHDRPEMDLYEAVRAVREASRLSECPAAVDKIRSMLADELIDYGADAPGPDELLRAAEDAAMGKGK
jgi:hypothetical protein